MHPALKCVNHRPWALPAGPWIMAQNWHDLLFVHWPVPVEAMRRLVPPQLELDCFEGRSWIGIVPFRMAGVRLRATPAVPWLSAFPELNVRTYVTIGGKPGVWFFSLDAANRVAVEVARAWFNLPYFRAEMSLSARGTEIAYFSRRIDSRGQGARFAASYAGEGETFHADRGTLDYFLTERYCLYAQPRDGAILCGEIHHAPWELRRARASVSVNTMAESLGLSLAGVPRLHFSRLQEVIVWSPQRIE